LKSLSPVARAVVKGRRWKSRKFVSLEGALLIPTEPPAQGEASGVHAYQDAAGTRIVAAADPWGTEEGFIAQIGADGKSLKMTPLTVTASRPKVPRKRGRKKLPLSEEEKRQRERQQTRERSRRSYGTFSTIKKKLRQAIRTARKKLSGETMRDVNLRKKAIEGIAEKVLSPCLNSKKAPVRKAAEQVKGEIERELRALIA